MDFRDFDHECKHSDFAMEANDLLRDIWNRNLLDRIPDGRDRELMKARFRKLLGVKRGEVA
jgi:hypothetical protein